jgi:hypothetical protein
MLTLALIVAGFAMAQTTQTYSDGTTTVQYTVAGAGPYTSIVCASTVDVAVDSFRIEYVASLPDGSEIRYDGFLLRRDGFLLRHPRASCQFVASTLVYPLLTGLVVTPHRATVALVAVPLPCQICEQ